MALTITLDSPSHYVDGHQYKVTGTIDFEDSYPTGGEALTAANIGLRIIDDIHFTNVSGFDIKSETALPATSVNVQVFNSAGFTPAGTNAKSTFVISNAAALGVNMAVGLDVDTDSALWVGDTGLSATRTLTAANSPVTAQVFTGTAVAAGALVQAANTTNLSAVTGVRFRAWGV